MRKLLFFLAVAGWLKMKAIANLHVFCSLGRLLVLLMTVSKSSSSSFRPKIWFPLVALHLSTWHHLKMSCRCEKKYPAGKILLEPTREHTANSTHVWRPRRDLNAGHVVQVRVLSLVRHPWSTPAPPAPTPPASTFFYSRDPLKPNHFSHMWINELRFS